MAAEIADGLTFDDVLLLPDYSEVLPSEVDTTSYLTRTLKLRVPILSAAMDTVTESGMAIAMAQLGGIGIVHKNLSPEEQAAEIARVKKYESVVITDPVALGPDAPLSEYHALRRKFGVSGFPVVENGRAVGIITNRDVRFEGRPGLKVRDVMTRDIVVLLEGSPIEEAKRLMHERRIEKILVVDAEQRLVGLISIKDIERQEAFPTASKDGRGRLLCGAAIGVGEDGLNRAEQLMRAGVDVIVVDTAHGHSRGVIETVRCCVAVIGHSRSWRVTSRRKRRRRR